MTDQEKLQRALAALADIGFSDDMTLKVARQKARRIYDELRVEQADPAGAGA